MVAAKLYLANIPGAIVRSDRSQAVFTPSQGRNFLKLFGARKVSALVPSSYHEQDFISDLRIALSRRVSETGLPSFGHS